MILNWLNFKHFIKQILFFSLLTLLSTTSLAAIYKWVDAEGNVHYGQQRPANASAERMRVPEHAPVDTSTYKRPGFNSGTNTSSTNTKEAEKNTAEEDEEVKETKAEKKQRLANCKQIRDNLAIMESRGRIRSKDKDGNTTYLSEEEKQARMKKSRDTLAKSCK